MTSCLHQEESRGHGFQSVCLSDCLALTHTCWHALTQKAPCLLCHHLNKTPPSLFRCASGRSQVSNGGELAQRHLPSHLLSSSPLSSAGIRPGSPGGKEPPWSCCKPRTLKLSAHKKRKSLPRLPAESQGTKASRHLPGHYQSSLVI